MKYFMDDDIIRPHKLPEKWAFQMRQIIYLTSVIRGNTINSMFNDIYRNLEGRQLHFGAWLQHHFSYTREICVMISSS